ncbi:MAG: hypothetical protein PF549_04850 [Patescibacteria group bacterium]|jgi:hypothetical protein|nr:hypothetical protein [Patescibacteria group bacterium]
MTVSMLWNKKLPIINISFRKMGIFERKEVNKSSMEIASNIIRKSPNQSKRITQQRKIVHNR